MRYIFFSITAFFVLALGNLGYCTDVHDGTKVQLCGDNGWPNQQWILKDEKDGFVTIVNAKNGEFALDAVNFGKENGTRLQTFSNLKGENQRWRIRELPDGYVSICSQSSGRYLDAAKDTAKNDGGVVQLWDWNGEAQQQWKMIKLDGGKVKFENREGGKLLDAECPPSLTMHGDYHLAPKWFKSGVWFTDVAGNKIKVSHVKIETFIRGCKDRVHEEDNVGEPDDSGFYDEAWKNGSFYYKVTADYNNEKFVQIFIVHRNGTMDSAMKTYEFIKEHKEEIETVVKVVNGQ